jgi:hypothetical protein
LRIFEEAVFFRVEYSGVHEKPKWRGTMVAPSPVEDAAAAASPSLPTQSSLASSPSSSVWTREQDKQFETALNIHDQDSPKRWENIAAMVPGKDATDVKRHFEILQEDVSLIDAGRIALPNYTPSSLSTSEEAGVSDNNSLGSKKVGLYHGQASGSGTNANGSNGSSVLGKGISSKSADQERRKGIPWSEEEHRSGEISCPLLSRCSKTILLLHSAIILLVCLFCSSGSWAGSLESLSGLMKEWCIIRLVTTSDLSRRIITGSHTGVKVETVQIAKEASDSWMFEFPSKKTRISPKSKVQLW